MFRRVLVANRGEIAVRIIRTFREMGITSLAAFSDADRDSLFVGLADEAYRLGPSPAAQSYLDAERVIAVALEARADAIHPGYGFLAESAEFAEAVQGAGLSFIGPSAQAITLLGDKVAARRLAADLEVPTVPGTPGPVTSVQDALAFAADVGYPVAVKASAGGGGRGIRVVAAPSDMSTALDSAAREAKAYFGDATVFIEKYFPAPRHVEIQILADQHGNVVHLGERDCSLQRRHQKLLEEAPSPAVDEGMRSAMGEMAIRLARASGYTSAGTCEFLLAPTGHFYFLEMNTRIQVEHPVTELVTGVDLIQEMTLAAAGESISCANSFADLHGHSIEVRINAEDPLENFTPTPTRITRFCVPDGPGVRVDSGVREGFSIPPDYDSLLAKLITWAPTREACRKRMLRALGEFCIEGPATTIPFARAVLEHPAFKCGEIATTFVSETMPELELDMRQTTKSKRIPREIETWTSAPGEERAFAVQVNSRFFTVRVSPLEQSKKSDRGSRRPTAHLASESPGEALTSPMHGTVAGLTKVVGDIVSAGEIVMTIEAMKMENEVPAHRSGTLLSIDVRVGDGVDTGQVLARIG